MSAEDRLLELIHDQSPTHEWCKADGGRGIGDAHYHELVEAVTAFLAARERPSALDVERRVIRSDGCAGAYDAGWNAALDCGRPS